MSTVTAPVDVMVAGVTVVADLEIVLLLVWLCALLVLESVVSLLVEKLSLALLVVLLLGEDVGPV